MALTIARVTNEPLRARARAMVDVTMMALAGVRNVGWIFPRKRGSLPFSASANSIRDPVSTWPAQLPDIETTEPIPIIKAPPAPMKRSDASASGVDDSARFGSVPLATIWASVMTVVTITIVPTSANGTWLRGSLASPAGTGTTSKPPNMKMSNSATLAAWLVVISGSGDSRPGSMKIMPTMMNRPSGTSLPTVSALISHALWRMPRTLMNASVAIMRVSIMLRPTPPVMTGQ